MNLDTASISDFFNLPFDVQLEWFLINVGWLPIAITIVFGALKVWLFWRQTMYDSTLGYILLAIDIPRGNEQSPKAVENMFTYFGGAHGTLNIFEKYWEGKFQQSFSFEIVCIDGYTQFIIQTPTQFRNLVETAVYSQYPDAEITEINDYTENVPTRYPNDEYDLWGGEFILNSSDAYPIKTWMEFISEMPGRPEGQFKDPMASLMDLCSSLKKGEQLWYQILVKPTGFDWMEKKQKEVDKILGDKSANITIVDKILESLSGWIAAFQAAISGGEVETKKEKEDMPLRMLNLKPREKKQVEAIQRKASKLGFECKNRFIYIAKKEVFNKPKGLGGFVGYMKQYMDLDLNNLKPDLTVTGTSPQYFFATNRLHQKQTKIINAYKNRSTTRGRLLKIFNIEELATLWHFPIETTVKASFIQKAPGRKAVPPMSLPVSEGRPRGDTPETASSSDTIFLTTQNDPLQAKEKPRVPTRSSHNKTVGDVPSSDADDIFKNRSSKIDGPQTNVASAPVKRGLPPGNLPIG